MENYLINNRFNFDSTITGNKIAKALAAKKWWMEGGFGEGIISNDLSKNNLSGFSMLPHGYRLYDGSFSDMYGWYGHSWASTTYSASKAFIRYLLAAGSDFGESNPEKNYGFCVRCVRD